MRRFNPYVVAGSIMALTGAYSISDEFQLVPKIILIIGMVLTVWNYDKISKALRIYRKMEGRNKRNGRSKEYVRLEQSALGR